jgi:polysaccharide deacetylase
MTSSTGSLVKVPIICYHSSHAGKDYASDDHHALAADLRTIHRLGHRIVPLDWVVESLLGERAPLRNCVALTCDDGVVLDWRDVDHPTFGWRQSFANILRQFSAEVGAAQPTVEMTSFVIASPDARKELEVTCLAGHPWWSDDWWHDADASGLLRIENHSWDHVHPGTSRVAQRDRIKGDFTRVDSFEDCEAQLAHASAFIERLTHRRPRYFAYPYGQASRYLREAYLPEHGARHGLRAAFSIDDGFVTEESDRWYLPRFTHGAASMTTSEHFEAMLGRSAT